MVHATLTCLECGAVSKQLSKRHLREYELTPRTYRNKYGISKTMSLAAKDTTARRRQAVQKIRPWEKTPRYRKAQASGAPVAKRRSQRRNGYVDQKSRRLSLDNASEALGVCGEGVGPGNGTFGVSESQGESSS